MRYDKERGNLQFVYVTCSPWKKIAGFNFFPLRMFMLYFVYTEISVHIEPNALDFCISDQPTEKNLCVKMGIALFPSGRSIPSQY